MSNESVQNPYFVRPRDEIEFAHDVMWHAVQDGSPMRFQSEEHRWHCVAAMNALAWVLGKDSDAFEKNVAGLVSDFHKLGKSLRRQHPDN